MSNRQQTLRYARQTLLPEFGEQGQHALASSRVLLIGAGGLGAPAALYLAGAGVGTLLIADGDQVDITNLHRQILYRSDDAGNSKSDCASHHLEQLNADISIEAIDDRLDAEALDYYVPEVNLVLDCSDNLATRLAVNRACYQHDVPLVFGAAIRWEGQMSVFDFRQKTSTSACYQCLFGDQLPPAQSSCAEMGIMGPVVGLVGTAMALEAIKLLTDIPAAALGKLHLFDGKQFSWQQIQLTKNLTCPVCNATGIGLKSTA